MLEAELLEFISPEILVLIPVLNIIGMTLKKSPVIKDWLIPVILGTIGIVVSIVLLGVNVGFTVNTIANGFIQGVLAAGMAVYVHQLKLQNSKDN